MSKAFFDGCSKMRGPRCFSGYSAEWQVKGFCSASECSVVLSLKKLCNYSHGLVILTLRSQFLMLQKICFDGKMMSVSSESQRKCVKTLFKFVRLKEISRFLMESSWSVWILTANLLMETHVEDMFWRVLALRTLFYDAIIKD
jgi:hypothetical protein